MFINQIQNATDDGVIVADFTNQPEISSGVFTALAGTNKDLTLTSSGISWEFNGADVDPTNVKNINLSTTIRTMEQEDEYVTEQLEDLMGENQNALVLHFADNGQLPGRARIRVKADYVLQQYLGTTGLDVFYWDETNNTLVPIASNVSVDANNDIIFDIYHCSYYVIRGRQEVIEESVEEVQEENDVNYLDALFIALKDAAAAGGNQTVTWNQGNSLPISVMKFLKENPQITLKMTYDYEGRFFAVSIPGYKAIVDETIPWYGPLWMAAHYTSTVSTVPFTNSVVSSGSHVVQKGDCLWHIAKTYITSVKDLLAKNPNIKNKDLIFPGQIIFY